MDTPTKYFGLFVTDIFSTIASTLMDTPPTKYFGLFLQTSVAR